jgi:hypothetical protein
MRSHGIPNFPDPIDGHFGFGVDSGIDPDSAQFKSAYSYCGARYLHVGTRSTPAQRAQWNAAAVTFAQCMRSHGLRDFPDPNGSGAILLPSQNYIDTPLAQRAKQACKGLSSGGFVLVSPVK